MMRYLIIVLFVPGFCLAQDELYSDTGVIARWLVPGWQTGNGKSPTQALNTYALNRAGSCSNAPIWSKRDNKHGLLFNGTNQFIQINNIVSMLSGTNGAISVWVYPVLYTNSQILVSFTESNAVNANQIYVGINNISNSMRPTFVIRENATTRYNAYGNSQLLSNAWNNITLVKITKTATDSPNPILYLNGIQIGFTMISGDGNDQIWWKNLNLKYASIGCRTFDETNQFLSNAYISDVRIYNQLLTSERVRNIWRQGLQDR